MKHNRIRRVMQILTTLQAGTSYTAGDLSKLFGTSRRTIFRDLKELQAIGVPYRYDNQTGGYTIEPDYFLPPVDLNLQEALSLLMLAHKVGAQIQLPYERSALLAALKIENNLPGKIRKYCNLTLKNISTKASAQAQTDHLDKHFSQLQEAVRKKIRVCMRYHSLFEGQVLEMELCPYHLHFNNRAWYVLGWSEPHKSVRTFKLNRIRELALTGKCFVGPDKFDVDQYFGRAWSMIPEGHIYNITLHFLPRVANNVSEVRWHSTQQVTRHTDGSATLEFRVDGLGEITWWILGYGDQVRVLAPQVLRRRVVQMAQNIITLNQ